MHTPDATESGLGPSGARVCRHAAPRGPDCRNACGTRKVARSCRARGAPAGRTGPISRSVPSCDRHGRVRVAHFREHVKGGQAVVHGGRRTTRTGGGARRRRGRAASQGGIRQGRRPACERLPAQGRRARVCTPCHGGMCRRLRTAQHRRRTGPQGPRPRRPPHEGADASVRQALPADGARQAGTAGRAAAQGSKGYFRPGSRPPAC